MNNPEIPRPIPSEVGLHAAAAESEAKAWKEHARTLYAALDAALKSSVLKRCAHHQHGYQGISPEAFVVANEARDNYEHFARKRGCILRNIPR